jgi:hypothetical protein
MNREAVVQQFWKDRETQFLEAEKIAEEIFEQKQQVLQFECCFAHFQS